MTGRQKGNDGPENGRAPVSIAHDSQKEKGFVVGGGHQDNAWIAFSNLSRQPQTLTSFIIGHLSMYYSKSAMVLFGSNRSYL
jgi:hypothetical protein